MKKIKIDWFLVSMIALSWIFACLLGSFVKVDSGNCGSKYPIDYIVFTSLFCEKSK